MSKLALVIGVSDYEPGLNPLPGAARDIDAMQRVLQHPDVGGFDDIKMLSNPEPLAMQEAIETLFSGRTKDDLVLLFFSGHGVKDDNGRLHLATRITRKTLQGELIRATAVPASFVQDIMSNSRSKRQVVILDCCFSGAFAEGWLAKDDGSIDVKSQLGGEGRAVLTSSTSTQYSFEQEGADLSTYTHYLVEGIETGAADLDSDGVVSIDELHEYAKRKVQEAAPAMKPEIYAVKEGYKIYLAQAPIEDPKLRYRKEVEHCANRGKISVVGRNTLDALQDGLGLLLEDAVAIENEVIKPYQEYQKKLNRYEQVLVEAIQHEHTLGSDTQIELKRLQQVLKLREEDISQIEAQVTSQKKEIQPSDESLERIQTKISLPKEGLMPVNPLNEAVAGNQSKTSIPTDISLKKDSVTLTSVLGNSKLYIGAGITAAVVLTFFFLARVPQSVKSSEIRPSASPAVSPSLSMSPQSIDYKQVIFTCKAEDMMVEIFRSGNGTLRYEAYKTPIDRQDPDLLIDGGTISKNLKGKTLYSFRNGSYSYVAAQDTAYGNISIYKNNRPIGKKVCGDV
jgi:Caspase domain